MAIEDKGGMLVARDGIGGRMEVIGGPWKGAVVTMLRDSEATRCFGVWPDEEHGIALDGSDALHLALHLLEAQCDEGSSAHPDQRAVLKAAAATLRAAMHPHWLDFLDRVGLEISECCSTAEQNAVRERHGLEWVDED